MKTRNHVCFSFFFCTCWADIWELEREYTWASFYLLKIWGNWFYETELYKNSDALWVRDPFQTFSWNKQCEISCKRKSSGENLFKSQFCQHIGLRFSLVTSHAVSSNQLKCFQCENARAGIFSYATYNVKFHDSKFKY